jgi:folate-dependent tRNA-U54 methylase TrmFO/GidA
MYKYNVSIQNIDAGTFLEMKKITITALRSVLKSYETKERFNNSIPDELAKIGKKIKTIKFNPIKSAENE